METIERTRFVDRINHQTIQDRNRVGFRDRNEPIGQARTAVINTPLQRGVRAVDQPENRFNGFSAGSETVETVLNVSAPSDTPLKRGVNERPKLLMRTVLVRTIIGFSALWLVLAASVTGILKAQPLSDARTSPGNAPDQTLAEDTNSPNGDSNVTRVVTHEESDTEWHSPIVVIGKDMELKAGESAEAVVVIGGSAKIHGHVQNAVVVIGGELDVDGEVGDAAVAVLGNLNAGAGAKIHGDAVAVGGAVNVSPGAKVTRSQQNVQFPEMKWLRGWFRHCVLLLRPLSLRVGWVWVIAGIVLLFYLLVAVVFPKPIEAIAGEFTRRPATSFLVGILSILVIPFVILILAVTGVGVVVIPFVLAAVFLGTIAGKVGLLEWLGFRIGRQFGGQDFGKPLPALLIGAAVILLLYLVPVLGLVTFAVTRVWGFGGAVLAAFGGLRREMPEKPAAPDVPAPMAPSPSPFPVAPLTTEPPGNPGPSLNPGASAGPELAQPTQPSDTTQKAAAAPTPIQATTAPLTVPPVPEVFGYPRSGFWERMGAGFLDVVLICIAGALVGPFTPLVALAYFAGMWTWKQTTIGGIVLGLKVARLDGRPVTFAVALVRGLAAGFSVFVLFLGFLWIAWDKEKQGWHDKIAGTVVLKLPRGTPLVCI